MRRPPSRGLESFRDASRRPYEALRARGLKVNEGLGAIAEFEGDESFVHFWKT
jgi:hypothetical protein